MAVVLSGVQDHDRMLNMMAVRLVSNNGSKRVFVPLDHPLEECRRGWAIQKETAEHSETKQKTRFCEEHLLMSASFQCSSDRSHIWIHGRGGRRLKHASIDGLASLMAHWQTAIDVCFGLIPRYIISSTRGSGHHSVQQNMLLR